MTWLPINFLCLLGRVVAAVHVAQRLVQRFYFAAERMKGLAKAAQALAVGARKRPRPISNDKKYWSMLCGRSTRSYSSNSRCHFALR